MSYNLNNVNSSLESSHGLAVVERQTSAMHFYLAGLMVNSHSILFVWEYPRRDASGHVSKGTSRKFYLRRKELHWMCIEAFYDLGI